MKYRKLDPNGDFTISTGADFYIDSPEAVVQAVKTRLALFLGDWFLDLDDGVPWRTEVLGKYTQSTYDVVVKQRILATPGIRSILSYSSNMDGESRSLSYDILIDTIYGTVTIQGTL